MSLNKMDVYKKLSSLQEISKAQLAKIFSVNSSTKFLIIEPSLIKPLERVCGVQWLKSSGVDKIFKLESIAPNFQDTAIFYMIPSEMEIFKRAVDQIRAVVDIENAPINKFHIIVIPRSLTIYEQELEEWGLAGNVVKLHSFQWMPIHLDSGVLSLEINQIFSSLFVYGNFGLMPVLSNALWQLSLVIGKPNVILALGQHSNTVLKQFDNLCQNKCHPDKRDSDFGALIIIDRNVDMPSALLTPGIYSGLLSEVYTVKSGVSVCKKEGIPEEGTYDDKYNPIPKKQPINITLNSNVDPIYGDIKNRYFTEVTYVLSSLTKQLKNEKVSSQDMALDEIKRYVQTQLQAAKTKKNLITNHLLAAESIINSLGLRYEKQKEVEVDIMKNTNKSDNVAFLNYILHAENDKCLTLRLFCLISITQRLSESETSGFWRKFLQHFGYKLDFALGNLMYMGLINDQSTTSINIPGKINLRIPKISSSNFYTTAKVLRQIPQDPDNVNLKHPTCASYVYGGAYIPLITQIAGMILNSVPLDDIKAKLESFGLVFLNNDKGYPLLCRNILVFMVGGVTYAEIAACNLLEILMGCRICILSDRVVNGNDLMADVLAGPS